MFVLQISVKMDKRERQRFLTKERVRRYRQRQKWKSLVEEGMKSMEEEANGSERSEVEDADRSLMMEGGSDGSERSEVEDADRSLMMEGGSDGSERSEVEDADRSLMMEGGSEDDNVTRHLPRRGRPPSLIPRDLPLYEGSAITEMESAILILSYVLESGTKKEDVDSLLNLIRMHCPIGSNVVSSKHNLFKLIHQPGFLTYHRFCPTCYEYIGDLESVGSIRTCNGCNSSLPGTDQTLDGTFVEFDIKRQLHDQLERHPCLSDERARSSSLFVNEESVIRNFKDGERYRDFLQMHSAESDDTINLSYTWGMDALQIFRTSKYQATPIYLRINELSDGAKKNEILCVGIWYGKRKAVSKSFLKPFIDRLNELQDTGIDWKGKLVRFHPILGCFDAVQKADLQCIHQFNGAFGCGACHHPGKRVKKGRGFTNVYPYTEDRHPLRSMAETIEISKHVSVNCPHIDGVRGESCLASLTGFDFILDAPPDPLHQLYIGVTKRMMSLWFDRENHLHPWYVGNRIKDVDAHIITIHVPSCIKRAPRPLVERNFYRGHEFENFLLYYGPILLKGVLPHRYYNHFLLLSSAAFVLSEKDIWPSDLEKAEKTLRLFARLFEELYGVSNMTYNLHQVTEHLVASVRRFGPLPSFTTSDFEAQHFRLKKDVRGTQKVHMQLSNIIQERLNIRACHSKISKEKLTKIKKKQDVGIYLSQDEVTLLGPVKLLPDRDVHEISGNRSSCMRLRTREGVLCHTMNYKFKGRVRNDSLVDVFTRGSQDSGRMACEVQEIVVRTVCDCGVNVCTHHSSVFLMCKELILARNSRPPASRLHTQNPDLYLPAEHVRKRVGVSDDLVCISPRNIRNSLVSIDNYILPVPNVYASQ